MSLVFDRDFDLELARESRQVLRDGTAYYSHDALLEAVSEARATAFAEGRRTGHAEGLAEAAGLDDAKRAAALLEAQLLDFSLSVCEQVFPELLRHRAHDRALAQVRRALSVGLGSATLQVSLSPEGLRLLREELDSTISEFGLTGRVALRADAALADGDTRVAWDSGFLEYSFSSICDRILCALRDARSAVPTHLLER